MTERMAFIARYRDGERVSDLCREFGISLPTGHSIIKRFEAEGVAGLQDRSSRPLHHPNKTPQAVTERIVALRRKHPSWGPKKLKERLQPLSRK